MVRLEDFDVLKLVVGAGAGEDIVETSIWRQAFVQPELAPVYKPTDRPTPNVEVVSRSARTVPSLVLLESWLSYEECDYVPRPDGGAHVGPADRPRRMPWVSELLESSKEAGIVAPVEVAILLEVLLEESRESLVGGSRIEGPPPLARCWNVPAIDANEQLSGR